MSRLSSDFIVEAPADAVWEVVGRRFHQIGEWATTIPASSAIPARAGPPASMSAALKLRNLPATTAAAVAGRVCHVGLRLLPQVEERLIAYDEANRTLTYARPDSSPTTSKTMSSTARRRRASCGSCVAPDCYPVSGPPPPEGADFGLRSELLRSRHADQAPAVSS